ncbi:Oidioi.mRNA.OKI2018_I69.PAR.g11419.t1.cds [Oikopleura dioica]|uniref:Oidioi.mRNA.OKI2018_I69.PAR.g11419.t1.cds n=1 Tax=Oikopleura dioica TaxID=34765 RepID=A0ABN7RVW7_OIKDI|nr:Oidioi.mRNA.OKI2018_I69.PAR.g11419.t1.cds [Oikopleura dioica]
MPALIQRIVEPATVSIDTHLPIIDQDIIYESHANEGYLYNYSGYGLKVSDKPRGVKRVRSKENLLTFIQIAQQLMLIQSKETGEFLTVSSRGKISSSFLATEGSLWRMENKSTHKKFQSFTNKSTDCTLSVNRRGKVLCRRGARKRSTSFITISRPRSNRRL